MTLARLYRLLLRLPKLINVCKILQTISLHKRKPACREYHHRFIRSSDHRRSERLYMVENLYLNCAVTEQLIFSQEKNHRRNTPGISMAARMISIDPAGNVIVYKTGNLEQITRGGATQ